MRLATLAACGGILLTGCGAPEPAPEPTPSAAADADLMARAERLTRDTVLVDTHIDVPWRFEAGDEDLSRRTEKGDFDHPRAVAGGLDAAFMSIFVPAEYQHEDGPGDPFDYANTLIDRVEGWVERWPAQFALATSPAEVREVAARDGVVALPLGMENGAPIREIADLAHFHARGIRYVTLTHGENNRICDSSYAEERTWNGLSPFGREVVAEMNRLGIMVDVSHVSDETLFQVLELSAAPVLATHSSCRHFTPGWERNMSDEGIRALAAKGGVLQINFGSSFLREDAQKQGDAFWGGMLEYAEANGLKPGAPELEAWTKEYWADKTQIFADVADVADHIDHVIALVGVDHVGIGSDYDGVGDSLPTGLKDVSQYPNLTAELLRRGRSEEDVAKILGGNVLRVWEAVEATAAGLRAGAPVSGS